MGRLRAAAPDSLNRVLAGRPIELDGQVLAADQRALVRATRLLRLDRTPASVAAERDQLARGERLVRGAAIEVGRVEERLLPGPAGELRARLYVPLGERGADALIVYFHGGGYVLGDLDTHDQACRFIAGNAASRVLSVAYRRAPEAPFPAAVDDALAAFLHVAGDPALFGADPERISVAGDSAGGGLAAAVAILAREAGGPAPARQVLIFPWVEPFGERRSHELFGEGFLLTREKLERWRALYLPGVDPLDADARHSPLRAPDLAGLPPALLLLAGFDPLRDEGLAYAERLRSAGNDVEVILAPDLLHGFVSLAGTSARSAEALEGLTERLRVADLAGTNARS